MSAVAYSTPGVSNSHMLGAASRHSAKSSTTLLVKVFKVGAIIIAKDRREHITAITNIPVLGAG
jgi:hypothetical protein